MRSILIGLAVGLCFVLPGYGQDASSLEGYFTGKQVVVKMDMPGTQKGVDLKFNKPAPMDWNDYSSRIKTYGVAIHKGEVARITKFVVKGDMIEFQLNGGGFGTAGDDSNTTVTATAVPKSQYEKDLEKQLSQTTDDKKRRELQQDLDRERSRRERQDAQNQSAAQIASQIKEQQVAAKRLQGGSRFNLRWDKTIPSDSRNPDAVMHLLADYVDFNASAGSAPVQRGQPSQYPAASQYPPQSAPPAGDPAQVKRGMRMDEVASMMGSSGRTVSQTVSNEGLKTQVIEYLTADSIVSVTYVEGVVVRYSMNSR
jgi:hypothetical protein